MRSVPKKAKGYRGRTAKSSSAAEAAPKYITLKGILGGNPSSAKALSGDMDLISLTREGIRKSSLKSLAGYLGISMETMSRLLHSSYRNIQRKDEASLLDTLKTEKVLELASLTQRGIAVTGGKQAFIEWLHSSLPSLGHKPPLDFLDTSFGIQLVEKILGRLEQGVYS